MDKTSKILENILKLCKDLDPIKFLMLGDLLHQYTKAILDGLKYYIKEQERERYNKNRRK